MSIQASCNGRLLQEVNKHKKLEFVGDLVAGIVHEIRNPLTSILGFVKLLEQGSIKQDYFQLIHSSCNDIEVYLDNLLLIAQPQPLEQKEVNIKQLIEHVIEKVKQKENYQNIHIVEKYESDIEYFICDAAQIKLVINHLLTNSLEAIANAGAVTIMMRREDSNLLIKITDNGVGMSQERLAKLGEPNFDLKEKGTGLGLMVCYRIIWQYNGSILVESEVNKGTTVEVRLPLFVKENL